MALKKDSAQEIVRHYLVTGVVKDLDDFLESKRLEGFKVIEAKLSNFDAHNQIWTVFYILVKRIEDTNLDS